MAKRYIGLEIGSRTVKIVLCENNRLLDYIVEPLPEHYVKSGIITSIRAMAEYLRNVARTHKIKEKRCRLILPESLTYTRTVTMPAMTAEQLKLNVPYEFRDFIPGRKDHYIYDYSVMDMSYDEEGRPTEMKIMAAAVSRKVMDEYGQMIRMAGWKLEAAAPVAFVYSGMIREYERRNHFPKPGEYCLADMGYESVRLWFFKGDCLEAKREIPMGLEQIIRAAADRKNVDIHVAEAYIRKNYQGICLEPFCTELYHRIAAEIRRTLEFYSYRNPDSVLDTMYFCGGGSEISGMKEAVARHVPLKLADIETVTGLPGECINLVQGESRVRRSARLMPVFVVYLMVLGIFVRYAVVGPINEMTLSTAALNQAMTDLSRYREYNSDYEAVEKQYNQQFHTYLTEEEQQNTDRYEKMKVIDQLVMPYADVVHISIEEQECQLIVTDILLSEVSRIVERLEEDPVVTHVKVTDVTADKDQAKVTAELMIIFSGGNDDVE